MYKPTIGLEIHVQLKTKTKMFCGCLNDSEEKNPNINVCPICMGHPGTLPTINKKAVEAVLKLGLALNGNPPAGGSKFDRKNYFYPDLPKGYQISQYDKPLVFSGELNGIKLRRIHLEEDTGSLIHPSDKNYSLVDFNRAGVPLMELVTEPDIESGEQAVEFAKELKLILRYLEISDADMEKGQMRVEANISLTNDQQPTTNNKLGTKVEVKNLNSFRAVGEAIDYEIKRQTEILESGKKVIHETRGWDEIKKKTEHQRLKEESHDYRYFPEPDLPILDSTNFNLEKLKVEVPELPAQKRERFKKEYDLKLEQAEILVQERDLSKYFEESVSELLEEIKGEPKAIGLLFNYLSSDLKGLMNEQGIAVKDLKITPENFADLVVLIVNGEISSRVAKDVLREMNATGLDPREIVKEKGLEQVSDEGEIKKVIIEIIGKNQKAAEDYKKGKEAVLQFLIGQAMVKLKGRGNPEILKKIFKETIK
ncbi:MAG: Asp-tRNA(Asn)/Glu-tRNA(Gln) amidotransferase subunit GatB [Patescibacteria group bacterium]